MTKDRLAALQAVSVPLSSSSSGLRLTKQLQCVCDHGERSLQKGDECVNVCACVHQRKPALTAPLRKFCC